ncbi:MAG: hypothetical protein HZA80_01720 [Candidatus Taylorbacteria bacterium]|nr:hypothetical protein [Candidatus Taylorbacteria bacterium]
MKLNTVLAKLALALALITMSATTRSLAIESVESSSRPAVEAIPLPTHLAPFLRTEEDLIAFLSLMQRSVSYGLSANSGQTWENSSGRKVWTQAPSQQEIIDTIEASNLNIGVLNPNDRVSFWTYTYDGQGRPLFSAGDSKLPFNDKGGWSLPEFHLNFRPYYQFPLPRYEGVYAAEILATDAQGRTRDQEWFNQDDDGVILMDSYLARKNLTGFLVFHMEDGSSRSYDLTTGNEVSQTNLTAGAKASFDGSVSFKDENIVLKLDSENGIGEKKNVQLRTTVKGTYKIKVSTAEGKYPLHYRVYAEENGVIAADNIHYGENENGQTGIELDFPIGLFTFVPVWNVADFREPGDCPPGYTCSGDGYGKGVVEPATK